MSRISGNTYSGTPNDQLKYVNTKVVSSGATALIVSLEDTNVTLTAGEINVSAFKTTAGVSTDAFLYSNTESLAAVTDLWEGIGGYDATADVFRALPVILDDSAMPATPAILPIGGEYRASATTYTDGDATVLQTDINGNLKVTTGIGSTATGFDTFFTASLTQAAMAIKASAGNLYHLTIHNANNAAPVFVQIFNAAIGDVNVGTTTPKFVIPVLAGAMYDTNFVVPMSCGTAITMAATSTSTGNGAPGGTITLSAGYK